MIKIFELAVALERELPLPAMARPLLGYPQAMARDNPMGAAAMMGTGTMTTSYCQPIAGQPNQFSCFNY
jgi:hypothetical protein